MKQAGRTTRSIGQLPRIKVDGVGLAQSASASVTPSVISSRQALQALPYLWMFTVHAPSSQTPRQGTLPIFPGDVVPREMSSILNHVRMVRDIWLSEELPAR